MREDWIEVELGEVCQVNMGQSPPSSTYNTDKKGLPFFQGKAEFTELHPIVEKWCTEPTKIAENNDILISVRAPVGATNVANQKCAIGRGLAAISYNYDYKYILAYLRLIEKKLDSQGTGTTFRAISGSILKSQMIPLAPLPIQRAIVQKIENLFASLDKGIADLKTAQEQLKVYRQAVLKKAFEGGFTNKNVKEGELPEGWKIVKFSDITNNLDGKRKPLSSAFRETFKGEYPYYGACEIIDFVKEFLFEGEFLLIGEDGANLLSKSKPLSFIAKGKFWVNNHAHIVQPKENVDIKFLNYQFNSLHINEYVTGTAQPKLNQLNLNKIPLIIPPTLAEQHAIVCEIESRLSVCDKVEQSIREALEKSEALRQSILKKAFEGKLLSEAEIAKCKQEADYEPASELLKKIKAEKK